MIPYGFRKFACSLHGSGCAVCYPPLEKRLGRVRAQQAERRVIEEQLGEIGSPAEEEP